jgi:hypothetical protein
LRVIVNTCSTSGGTQEKGKIGWNSVYQQNWWFTEFHLCCMLMYFYAGFLWISSPLWAQVGFWCFLTLWITLLCSWLYVKSLQLVKSFHFGHFGGIVLVSIHLMIIWVMCMETIKPMLKILDCRILRWWRFLDSCLASFHIFISVAMNGQESMLQLQDHRYWQALDLASCTNDVHMHMYMLLGGYENLSLKEGSFVCLVCWPCLTRQGYCVENHYRV